MVTLNITNICLCSNLCHCFLLKVWIRAKVTKPDFFFRTTKSLRRTTEIWRVSIGDKQTTVHTLRHACQLYHIVQCKDCWYSACSTLSITAANDCILQHTINKLVTIKTLPNNCYHFTGAQRRRKKGWLKRRALSPLFFCSSH